MEIKKGIIVSYNFAEKFEFEPRFTIDMGNSSSGIIISGHLTFKSGKVIIQTKYGTLLTFDGKDLVVIQKSMIE